MHDLCRSETTHDVMRLHIAFKDAQVEHGLDEIYRGDDAPARATPRGGPKTAEWVRSWRPNLEVTHCRTTIRTDLRASLHPRPQSVLHQVFERATHTAPLSVSTPSRRVWIRSIGLSLSVDPFIRVHPALLPPLRTRLIRRPGGVLGSIRKTRGSDHLRSPVDSGEGAIQLSSALRIDVRGLA